MVKNLNFQGHNNRNSNGLPQKLHRFWITENIFDSNILFKFSMASSASPSLPEETKVTVSDNPGALNTKSIDGSHWFWFFIGFLLGILISIFGILPLFFLSDLKRNEKNRYYYLSGWLLPVIIEFVLFIIFLLIVLALSARPF